MHRLGSRAVLTVLVIAGLLVAIAPSARADDGDPMRASIRQEIESALAARKNDFRFYWKNGLNLETPGGVFKAGFHGRLMSDWTFFDDADPAVEAAAGSAWHSGHQFRRAWLMVNGSIGKYVHWMTQYDFSNARGPGFLDVWVALKNLNECWGCAVPDVQFGHYQEPFGLAWLTSSKYFQLTAWPTATTAFTPGYNTGVTLSRQFWGDRITARVGFFGTDSDANGEHEWRGGYAATGRVTFLPWAPCDCPGRVLHLGVSASVRRDVDELRFRTRADVDLGPFILDTGAFAADAVDLLDLELAWVYDRFNLQAEYMFARVDADVGTDPDFHGGYVQAGYFLTGPGRTYSKKSAAFGQVIPCTSFLSEDCRGWGAFEVAARFSYVDLDDGDKRGGTVTDWVVGVNWYLHANARIMLNYVHADVDDAYGVAGGDGTVNSVVLRLQVHW